MHQHGAVLESTEKLLCLIRCAEDVSARARTYLEGRLESEGLVLAVMLMAVSVGQ